MSGRGNEGEMEATQIGPEEVQQSPEREEMDPNELETWDDLESILSLSLRQTDSDSNSTESGTVRSSGLPNIEDEHLTNRETEQDPDMTESLLRCAWESDIEFTELDADAVRLLEREGEGYQRLGDEELVEIGPYPSICYGQCKSEQKERVIDTYWPKLKEMMKKDTCVQHRLDMECPICFEKMRWCDDTPNELGSHRAVISPCGHIFGESCIYEMLTSDQNSDRNLTCPVCRASLKHGNCKHPIKGAEMPYGITSGDLLQQLERMPLTIPEGNKMPRSCIECLIARSFSALKSMGDILFEGVDRPDATETCWGLCAAGSRWECHYIEKPDGDFRRYMGIWEEGQEILDEVCEAYGKAIKRELRDRWCHFNIDTLAFSVAVYEAL